MALTQFKSLTETVKTLSKECMPDPATITPPDPQAVSSVAAEEPQGTPLWNLQTQQPEWMTLDRVPGALASGAYKEYAGSAVTVKAGIGGEGAMSPSQAAAALAGGAVRTESGAQRSLAARKQAQLDSFDNSGDKALAFADGVVGTLSGGIVDGVPLAGPGTKLQEEARALRGQVNSGYKDLGEIAALAATFVAPESAIIKASPLGVANEVFSGVSGAAKARLGGSILSTAASEGLGGAAAAGVLSSAHAVSQAVQGHPVSGSSIVDDVGLGALLGTSLGLVGGAIGKAAEKVVSGREEVAAAARFEENATAIQGAIGQVSNAWHESLAMNTKRMKALSDLVDSGMLDASMPGEEWLSARSAALQEANTAAKKLHTVAGTEDPAGVAARIADLAANGKAKEVEKLYSAFDTFGTKISALDDAMRPSTIDHAHLGDIVGDLAEEPMAASDHPFQRIEQMIQNGTPADEVNAFIKRYEEQEASAHAGPEAAPTREAGTHEAETSAPPEAKTGGGKVRKVEEPVSNNTREIPGMRAEPVSRATVDIRKPVGEPAGPLGEAPGAQPKPGLPTSLADLEAHYPEMAGAFRAKRILSGAAEVPHPMRPTELGGQIQSAIDQLTQATGGKLGTAEGRELARKLGMNMQKMSGPVSQKLADLWSLHRMSEALGKFAPKARAAKSDVLAAALKHGVVSSIGGVGYSMAGRFGSGAIRTVAGAALQGAAGLTAIAGRAHRAAIVGMAKVLSPTGRRAFTMAGVMRSVSTTYMPGEEPTTDYETKAKQLRAVVQAPDFVKRHIGENMVDIKGIDPIAHASAVDSAFSRLQNLANHLPTNTSISAFQKTMKPGPGAMDDWHAYEAVTHNHDLIFQYLKAGVMPESVKEAMQEQHPEWLSELRQYVMDHQDEVMDSPQRTQLALSKLLDAPIVPEADPQFVLRMQEPYEAARNQAAQKQQAAQGAAALKSGTQPTPVQLLVIPH